MRRPEFGLLIVCCLTAAPAAAQSAAEAVPASVEGPLVAPAVTDTTRGGDSTSVSVVSVPPDTLTAPDTARVLSAVASNGDPAAQREGCPWGPNRKVAQGAAAATFVGANVELFRRFKNAWWSGEKSDGFFFNADWGQPFRDQDKFGHLYGGYHLTRGGYTLLRGACVGNRKAIALSALYATLFQLQIELWDAKYEKYGFSYPDLLANSLGMGLGVLHAAKPGTRIVKPTISYRRTAAMKDRRPGDEIRHSIDYAGQTYWFSLDVEAVLPDAAKPYWPGIIRFSVGHSITDWILPRPPGAPEGTPQQVVLAQRRILLSLDLEAERLPGNHPLWKFVKQQLGFIRLPAPALQIAPSVEMIPWYR